MSIPADRAASSSDASAETVSGTTLATRPVVDERHGEVL